ncbi:elongation factor P (EF-P) family protein [Actinidia rufa]|uniref:Elongation factor P (EF-P) family protein n=1 Tax=Actinidia rufa TaxID=165716 RepID=A0A7J0HCG5_9ERIC|nr:elongation factor P (EF-P) family protein [Actinidia rufa]
MRVARKPLSQALYYLASTSSSSSYSLKARTLNTCRRSQQSIQSPDHASRGVLASPWSATQLRGAKYRGSDVSPLCFFLFFRDHDVVICECEPFIPCPVIQISNEDDMWRIYQVLKAQHTVQGRGGACIQVELRDVDSGNKTNERLRTDEAIEKVFVEEKPYTYLYTEDDFVVLSDPKTYDQLDVPKALFGEAAVYLKDALPPLHCQVLSTTFITFVLAVIVHKGIILLLPSPILQCYIGDDMKVTVQLYDQKPMSASVPQRVTCKVVEAQVPMKGIAATPHYKKVLLDNGLTVQVPAHVLAGDQIVINTSDNSYLTR